jgi:hypothetical protein
MEMVRKHGNSVEDEVVSSLGSAQDAEKAVVEVGAGLEQEASLNSPAGDGDEGVEWGSGMQRSFLAIPYKDGKIRSHLTTSLLVVSTGDDWSSMGSDPDLLMGR